MSGQLKRLFALFAGSALRFVGYWLAEYGNRIDAWAGIEPIKAGGTSSDG